MTPVDTVDTEPVELALEEIAELRVDIADPVDAGALPAGRRRLIPITGGRAFGPRIHGEVLDSGSDWNSVRADGRVEVDARYLVRTDDDVVLEIRNRGTFDLGGSRPLALTAARIEAPSGPYDWLNDTPIVGAVQPLHEGPKGVSVRFYRVTTLAD